MMSTGESNQFCFFSVDGIYTALIALYANKRKLFIHLGVS
jgi:hypothetical protein